MKRTLLLAVALPLLAQPPQTSTAARAIEFLRTQEKQNGFSGSVLLVKNGETILRTGIGLANRELEVPNKPETKYRLGSITKQFTATAIMQLAEAGKLSVQDAIQKHLKTSPDDWKDVTIHHLLTHTSGIPSFTEDPSYAKNMFRPTTLTELIARFRDKPLEFPPGSKFKYDNSGYVLLGAIIEAASGEDYETYLRKHIFDPLGMKDTGYDHFTSILPNRATGYSRKGGRWSTAEYLDMSQPHGAGALYSTVDDLHLWHKALLTAKVLPQESLQRMFTPNLNNYGYGWIIRKQDGKTTLSHGGGINGFATVIVRIPAEDSLIVILSNVEQSDPGRIANALAAILEGRPPAEPSKPRQQISMTNEAFDVFTGTYQLGPNFAIKVFREGNRFLTQATGQGQIEIYPESPTGFFVKVMDAQLTFERDAAGKVTGLVVHQNGRNMPGKRVE